MLFAKIKFASVKHYLPMPAVLVHWNVLRVRSKIISQKKKKLQQRNANNKLYLTHFFIWKIPKGFLSLIGHSIYTTAEQNPKRRRRGEYSLQAILAVRLPEVNSLMAITAAVTPRLISHHPFPSFHRSELTFHLKSKSYLDNTISISRDNYYDRIVLQPPRAVLSTGSGEGDKQFWILSIGTVLVE